MLEQIKYIVATQCDVYPENDYHYIAKQGPAGPIDLTEAEMDDVVRWLNSRGRAMGKPTCHGRPTTQHQCETVIVLRHPWTGGLITQKPLSIRIATCI